MYIFDKARFKIVQFGNFYRFIMIKIIPEYCKFSELNIMFALFCYFVDNI